MPNKEVSDADVVIANVLALFCFWIYYKSCKTSPGEITKENVRSKV